MVEALQSGGTGPEESVLFMVALGEDHLAYYIELCFRAE